MVEHPLMRSWEVGALLGVSASRVYQLARSGALPHVRRGRALLFPRDALQQWLRTENERAMTATGASER